MEAEKEIFAGVMVDNNEEHFVDVKYNVLVWSIKSAGLEDTLFWKD
jgi:hypothetical protein